MAISDWAASAFLLKFSALEIDVRLLSTCWMKFLTDGSIGAKNVFGYTPIHTTNRRIGANTVISLADRSFRPRFFGLVTSPNITRWNIHSMYTAANMTPLAAMTTYKDKP